MPSWSIIWVTNPFLYNPSEDDFFAKMVVKAISNVRTVNWRGDIRYPVKAVNILKAHGKSMTESMFIDGYALNCTVASQGN